MHGSTDAELMAGVGRGDERAFARLVDRHKDAVVGYLCRMTDCRERAEELAQETFLRLYRSAGRYSENGHLKAYLFRIATNLVRSDARRERRRLRLGGPLERLDTIDEARLRTDGSSGAAVLDGHGAPSPHAALLRTEVQREVSSAIAALPLHYREPLVLRDIEEWSYDEIARATGARTGTVKSRISRGRRLLRERLAPFLDGRATRDRPALRDAGHAGDALPGAPRLGCRSMTMHDEGC